MSDELINQTIDSVLLDVTDGWWIGCPRWSVRYIWRCVDSRDSNDLLIQSVNTQAGNQSLTHYEQKQVPYKWMWHTYSWFHFRPAVLSTDSWLDSWLMSEDWLKHICLRARKRKAINANDHWFVLRCSIGCWETKWYNKENKCPKTIILRQLILGHQIRSWLGSFEGEQLYFAQ